MAQQRKRSRIHIVLLPTTQLALWRVRQTWGMLFFTGLGMLAAVMLVCAVPLYSRVATTAGLRSVLTQSVDAATVAVSMTTNDVTSNYVSLDTEQYNFDAQPAAPYLDGSPQLFIPTQSLQVLSKPRPHGDFSLLATDLHTVSQHAKLLQGHFPGSIDSPIEIALTQETAKEMKLSVGSTLLIELDGAVQNGGSTRLVHARLPLHVSGIFIADTTNDVFWHGYSLDPLDSPGIPPSVSYTGLISSKTLLSIIDDIGANGAQSTTWSAHGQFSGEFVPDTINELNWYYQINTSRLDIAQLDDLITQLSNWQNQVGYTASNLNYNDNLTIIGAAISIPPQPSSLEQYRSRIEVTRIPVTILLFQIMALILLFLTMMTNLLIERQADTIAVIGSRGANKRQIFGAFFTQGIMLALIALLVGPILAVGSVYAISRLTLTPAEQGALNIISRDVLAIIWGFRNYALLAFVVTIAAMAFATYRAVNVNVLELRREAARTRVRPVWQRLNLDLVMAVIALTGYIISLYLNSLVQLDARTQALILSPLSLIAPLFLLLAGMLVLLRLFPRLLQLGAVLATRGRGAPAMLAFGHLSRTPQQSLRLLLLLTLTSAFAIFALVFNASQVQHITDLTNYQVGADFSGPLPTQDSTAPLKRETSIVEHIQGVVSATPGYASNAVTGGENPIGLQLRAVDADTFARTALWTTQDSSQPLSQLMQQLVAQRNTVSQTGLLPAIVDANTWNTLKLAPGSHFELRVTNPDDTGSGTITCVALAEVQLIPTTGASGGVLLDYQSYAQLYQSVFHFYLPVNYLWVKTRDDATSVNHVHAVLTSAQPRINPLADRRELVSQMSQDPLYLDLLGVLALGTITAILLALAGNLLASWLHARNRQMSFVVLRALGTSTQQIASVLSWEQGMTYVSAVLLGILFGALLALTATPALVFSTVPQGSGNGETLSTADFYRLQHLLPVRIAVPSSLFVALLLLVVICIAALIMMIRMMTQTQTSQMLRLNQD